MPEFEQQEKSTLWNAAAESGAKEAGKYAVDRALNALGNFVKARYGEAQVLLGMGFQRYLENASQRYNQVRTLATGTNPRSIVGQDSIYVQVGVSYKEKEISTATVDPMLRISRNLLISGTGGIGKSMLMRYLFLNTAHRGEYVPVMLELRRISSQTPGQLSILELIYSCMEEYDVELPREQFEYSLRLGKYLFLFDGFDEVKEALAAETAGKLQLFAAKYPKNPCIITSRPREEFSAPLETFTTVESMSLSRVQAVQLASKIAPRDETAREFCRQLDESLYEKHQGFAKNPLLLSMMFLTFMRNCSIPDHLADFYQKAYDALYNTHDSLNKGFFQRDFQCKTLREGEFKLLLSHFCFHTYFKEIYEFSEGEILSWLERSIQKLKLPDVQAKDFLGDLRNAVCMIVKDGDIYRFSHRSFQTYFAARYTADVLTDEQQKKLFDDFLSGEKTYWDKRDYYKLVYQIEPERFSVNALEEELRYLQKQYKTCIEPDFYWLRAEFETVSIDQNGDPSYTLHETNSHLFNTVTLSRKCTGKAYISPLTADQERELRRQSQNWAKQLFDEKFFRHGIMLDKFSPKSPDRTSGEKEFLKIILELTQVPATRQAVAKWLSELDAKRAALDSSDFIDDL